MGKPKQARFACNICRGLKRKCPRDLPSCSLCIRLGKDCEYPPRAVQSQPERAASRGEAAISQEIDTSVAIDRLHSLSVSGSNVSTGDNVVSIENEALTMFFLDSSAWNMPLSSNRLKTGMPDYTGRKVDHEAEGVVLGMSWYMPTRSTETCEASLSPETHEILKRYFSTIHPWLPLLSEKRFKRNLLSCKNSKNSRLALLLSCMKLLVEPLPSSSPPPPTESCNYRTTKELLYRTERETFPSLLFLQSLILVCVYEIGHAIYPAAYLSIGHAARVAIMYGLHDRKRAPQLFGDTTTWAEREEERRAWWTVFILDRLVSAGNGAGFQLSTPEPCSGQLLPCHEMSWDAGEIGVNEPIPTVLFSENKGLGKFPRVCQAAILFGRVLQYGGKGNAEETAGVVHLNSLVVSLQEHIEAAASRGNTGITLALAMCLHARLILNNSYARQFRGNISSHIPEAAWDVCKLARRISNYGVEGLSPLICATLFAAAKEAEYWLSEHDDLSDAWTCLRETTELLDKLRSRWRVAGVYLAQIYKWPVYKQFLEKTEEEWAVYSRARFLPLTPP
ncbi:hypothetical protein F5Y16DRAFT_81431 [Xylariaceae sp. FL0255]|nr:hypothetical protein F5Y16DRAFT_81431 [Xylariaceae sp. FL0255]